MSNREFFIVALFALIAVIAASLTLLSLPVALIIITGCTIAILVFFTPFYGLLLYIFLLYFRPQDFIPALGKLRIMLILAVFVIVSLLTNKILRKKPIGIFTMRQNVFMFILLVLVPISDLVNGKVDTAWESLNDFLTLFLTFFIIVEITSDKVRVLFKVIACAAVLLAINGLIQHFRGIDFFGQEPVHDRIRWIGIFSDPNDFALLLVSSMPIPLFFLFEKKINAIKRIALFVLLAILIAATFFTNSRGGQIALIIALGFFALKRWGMRRGAIAGVLFVASAVLIAPGRMIDLSPYGMSASGRVYAWIDGLIILKAHPILGVGFNKFMLYHSRASHSAFIQCMAELGLVGYFFWLALIYTCFKDLITVEKQLPGTDLAKYAIITQVAMVGFLCSAYFLSQAYNPVIYILFAISTVIADLSRGKIHLSPRLLTIRDVIVILAIEGGSILSYKLLAMMY